MSAKNKTLGLGDNLTALQAESLTHISLFVGLVGYIWGFWVIWPVTGEAASSSAWIGAILLILSATVSHMLKPHHQRAAGYLLVGGIMGAITSAMLAFQAPGLLYLFILPIIFANTLLPQQAILPVAIIASFLILITARITKPSFSVASNVALPIIITATVTVASWLSARNLYTALAWAWSSFRSAQRNERLAQEQQAELRRILKALDETTYHMQRANHMLTLARNQAEEARRLKQQFAQTISHELRTPINLIVGFTELMIESPEHYGGQLPPNYNRDLNIVYRNASHLQKLVNDVLDLARIEAAQMVLATEEIDPGVLIREAVNTVRSLVEARGLRLRVELQPDLPRIRADPTRIRQVLFNLINNAVRFTTQGTISVSAWHQGEEIIFAVKDTGVGIAPEDIPRIFEEFQQLDGTARRSYGGAGLGLAISQRFVKLHSGRIWVESEVGHGSEFYFSLPLGQSFLDNEPGRRLSQETSMSPIENAEERIQLAVTRSPSAAAMLTRYMHNARTVTVQDLDQARCVAQQLIPQAVIIDNTHGAFNPTNLEELARDWETPNTFFIACPLPGEKLLSQQLGVNGYLVKPISRQSLWDMLRQFGEDVDKVLVVDDDRDFTRLLRRMLESHVRRRYQVITASSAKEAFEKMRYHQPDLVLLDLMLPDENGLQAIEDIRSTPKWQHIPIVIISAYEELNDLKTTGGVMTITKANGLAPAEIVRCIHSMLDRTTLSEPIET